MGGPFLMPEKQQTLPVKHSITVQEQEIWNYIPRYKGRYQVSNLGRIRSVNRYIKTTNRWGKPMKSFRLGRIMKPGKANNYSLITLHTKGKREQYLVHRLIALVFISNPLNLSEVNHKNGIRTDNRVENLEWITRKGNVHHARNVLKRGRGIV
jgi:hypothetical protein